MKQSAMLALLQECGTIGCVYDRTSQEYTYKVTHDQLRQLHAIEDADDRYVVVQTPSKLKIVKAISLHDVSQIDLDAPYEYKWIVQVVDIQTHKHLCNADTKALALMQANEREKYIKDFMETQSLSDETIKEIKSLLE